ncbi:MAG TPA: aminoacyl-tRNA hydrolase [Clostridiales bacterium]|nr:aminoacyl-tRNA hydrolase [Clostridiales bacterium]
MFVIIGLGNPGREYENNRHNVGFHVIDILAERNNICVNKISHKALMGEGRIGSQRVMLAKPQTFMNLSGLSVVDILRCYKLEPGHLILIYDDIDLEVGDIRIRAKGGAGTHNGMRSVIYHIGSEDFPRIRIGIGKPEDGTDLAQYVTSDFDEEDMTLIKQTIERAARAAECIVCEGIVNAMNKYN